MLDLSSPNLDFVQLALGHGLPASRAHTAAGFAEQLATALQTPGPRLIEAILGDPATFMPQK